MTLPKFSILIPTYNRSMYLKQALESVLAQDYPHFEVIVSDNASTDGTSHIRSQYVGNPKVRWYRNETNVGLAANWRLLMYQYAQNDYVKILADDDYLGTLNHLSEAARVIEINDVDVVFAGAGSYDELTKMMVDRSWDIPELLTPRWWIENIGRKEAGKTLFPNLTTDAIFRLEKAKSLKAFINPVFGMDYQLAFELMLSGSSVYLKGIHGVERKHSLNDGLNASLDVVMTSMKLYDRLLTFGLNQGLAEKNVREFCRRFMTVMVNGFVLYTWSRERGNSFRSLKDLYRILKEKDHDLAKRVLLSPMSMLRFFLGGTPARQDRLRRLYYRFCKWRNSSS